MTITLVDDNQLKSDLGDIICHIKFDRGHPELPGEFAKMRQYGLNETQHAALNNLIAGCEHDNINDYIIETFNVNDHHGIYCAVVVEKS